MHSKDNNRPILANVVDISFRAKIFILLIKLRKTIDTKYGVDGGKKTKLSNSIVLGLGFGLGLGLGLG